MWTKHRERYWPERETYSPGDPAFDFISTLRLFSCFPRKAWMLLALTSQTTSHQPTHRHQWFILREHLKPLSFIIVHVFIGPPLEKDKGIVNELMDFLKLLLKQHEWTSKLKGKVTSPDTYRFKTLHVPFQYRSSMTIGHVFMEAAPETFKWAQSPGFWTQRIVRQHQCQ